MCALCGEREVGGGFRLRVASSSRPAVVRDGAVVRDDIVVRDGLWFVTMSELAVTSFFRGVYISPRGFVHGDGVYVRLYL